MCGRTRRALHAAPCAVAALHLARAARVPAPAARVSFSTLCADSQDERASGLQPAAQVLHACCVRSSARRRTRGARVLTWRTERRWRAAQSVARRRTARGAAAHGALYARACAAAIITRAARARRACVGRSGRRRRVRERQHPRHCHEHAVARHGGERVSVGGGERGEMLVLSACARAPVLTAKPSPHGASVAHRTWSWRAARSGQRPRAKTELRGFAISCRDCRAA